MFSAQISCFQRSKWRKPALVESGGLRVGTDLWIQGRRLPGGPAGKGGASPGMKRCAGVSRLASLVTFKRANPAVFGV